MAAGTAEARALQLCWDLIWLLHAAAERNVAAALAASPTGEGSEGREGAAEGAAQCYLHVVTALVDAVATQEVMQGLSDKTFP